MSGTEILLSLLGGVALLLWGLRTVRSGMTGAFGGAMQRMVGRALANRFGGFCSGLGLTLLLQSSTATALLVSSFITRGIVGGGSIAALLGADLGSALVANLLAQSSAILSPLLLIVGALMYRLGRGARWRETGRAIVGLGMMLLALQLIVAASEPLRMAAVMEALFAALGRDMPLALLVGFGLAWLAHSSLAAVLLIATLTGDLVTLPTALALVLGANIGNAMPPLVATWSKSPPNRRIPIANVILRLAGVLLAWPLVGFIVAAFGSWQLGWWHADALQQVVNFHLLFNLALALVFLPLVGVVARLVTRLLPDEAEKEDQHVAMARHLDMAALESPPVALANAVRDAAQMGEIAERMLAELEIAASNNNPVQARRARDLDDTLDLFYADLMAYLSHINDQELSEEDSRRCADVLLLTINLEHIGDLLDANVGERVERMARKGIVLPADKKKELLEMFAHTRECLRLAFAVFLTGDLELVRQLLALKIRFAKRERQLSLTPLGPAGDRAAMEANSAYIDLLANLKHIISYASAVAYPIADRAGLLRGSRLRKGEETSPEAPAESS